MWGNTNRTALHVAARYGRHECIEGLILNGADIEKQDKDGRTPLELAAWKSHCLAIQELVRLGANKPWTAHTLLKNIGTCLDGLYYSPFMLTLPTLYEYKKLLCIFLVVHVV